MEWNIIPNKGIGAIDFGLTREIIRSLLDAPVESFNKSKKAKIATDSFKNLGMFVYYDKHDKCEAIEFYTPASPRFHGEDLFKLGFEKFNKMLLTLDKELEEDEVGLTSKKLGIGCYAPDKEDDINCLIESIIIFDKGYYD
jgi:hypothetical protein